MDLRFDIAETGESVYVNVRANAVSLAIDEAAVHTFDLEGRLFTAFIDGRTYLRGLDNRVLAKWREDAPGGWRRKRLRLDAEAAGAIVAKVHADVVRVLSALERGEVSFENKSLPQRELEEIRRRLNRAVRFDYDALAADALRLAAVYKPVTILPPDRYLSLVLQATEGCSYNRCSFCGFYRERSFRIKAPKEFEEHVRAVLEILGEGARLRRSVFLADANALCIPRDDLLPLLDIVNGLLPVRTGSGNDRTGAFPEGIHSFVDAFSSQAMTATDFAQLRNRNVRRLYLGVETGCAGLLRFLRKPQVPEEVRRLVGEVKAGGLNVGIILMPGIGGDRFADRHVSDSLELLASLAWSPGDLVFLSEFVEFPGLEYRELARQAGIRPLTPGEIEAQCRLFRTGIDRMRRGSWPKVARYDVEEFLY